MNPRTSPRSPAAPLHSGNQDGDHAGEHRIDGTRPTGTLTIGLFAGMAAAVGSRTVEIAWTGGTAAALRRRLAEEFPAVAALAARSAVAIGAAYVTEDAPIPPGSAVTIIPPVSGG
jgi:molybdopterin converting factor small subunit